MQSTALLQPLPLTADVFAPYGRVLQVSADAAGGQAINSGTSSRHVLLDDALLTADGGRPVISLSRAQARQLPMDLVEMERHVHGSQAFVPLGAARRLVLVVARAGRAPRGLADLAAFISDGQQGVWLAPGTWHHPLLALDAGDFLVLERCSGVDDCDVVALAPPIRLVAPP